MVPFASQLCFFSFPSHLLPFFHFHKDICILVMLLPFSLPVQLWFFFPECIAFNLLLCFLFFQLSWQYLKPVSPTLKSYHTLLLFADFGAWSWGCFYTYRYHPLGNAAHPRALEKHHLTFLLCSFTHAGEFRHFCYMLEHLARINNYFILFTFSGSLFLNSVIVIALFLIAT